MWVKTINGLVGCCCLCVSFSLVLPKFEVSLTGPNQLERDDEFIEAEVEAKYTFGENVVGRVKINATLMSSQRGESLVFFDQTASLVSAGFLRPGLQSILVANFYTCMQIEIDETCDIYDHLPYTVA